jgi:two-component system, NarL family, sensor kinase
VSERGCIPVTIANGGEPPAQALGIIPMLRERDARSPGDEAWGASLGPVVDALSTRVVVLDLDGRIVGTNEAWRKAAVQGNASEASVGVGVSYLAACEAAAHDEYAAQAAAGLRAVLRGDLPEFRLVYPCAPPDGPERWFLLRATRAVEGRTGRVVVTHDEVSELKRAEQAVHDLTGRLLVAQDEERRALARELHDGTSPTLVGLSLGLAGLSAALPEGPSRNLAEDCARLCEQALRELRTVTFLLHPPQLERDGLPLAVRCLADGFERRSGVRVSVDVSGATGARLAPDAELALYRVVQETLTNVHRHSGSRTAHVALSMSGGGGELVVADRGDRPPALGSLTEGVGIVGMRERLRAVGGHLELAIGDGGHGLIVRAHVPPID